MNSERSDEPAQSRQRIRCLLHTIAVGLCHICDIGIFSSDIYEGVQLLSVYTQLSSGVIGLGFDLNSKSVFIFLHK